MKTTIEVSHQVVSLTSSFDQFTHNLENMLVPLDYELLKQVGREPAAVEEQLQKTGGEGFVFMKIDHGLLLTIVSAPRKAMLYAVGNPLVLLKMSNWDIRAALYGPLHLLVYEDTDGKAYVEYDLPSSLYGQFGNPGVKKIGENVDGRITELIAKADQAPS